MIILSKNLPRIFPESSQNLPRIIQESSKNHPRIFPEYSQNLGIFPESWNLPRNPLNSMELWDFIIQTMQVKQQHSSPKTNKGALQPAATFMEMVEAFDSIMGDYDYSDYWLSAQEKRGAGKKVIRPLPNPNITSCYLYQHLRSFVQSKVTAQSSGLTPGLTCPTTDNSNRQVRLPITIRRCLIENRCDWKPQNVTITWLVAYLHRNLPNTQHPKWQKFTLSHRCLSAGTGTVLICLCGEHMVWEKHSTNLGRGYRLCRGSCTHCNEMLCHCQGIHNPCCI